MIIKRAVPHEVELKGSGEGEALIIRWHTEDKDGDISEPGWIGTQSAPLLVAHDWRSVPVGRGTLSETKEGAVYRFALAQTPRAQELGEWLRFDLAQGGLQQWSYGYTAKPGAVQAGTKDGRRVRYLRGAPDGGPGCTVHEVSAVLVGSGERTQTLSMRSCDLSRRHGLVLQDIADRYRLKATDPLIQRAISTLRRRR